MNQTESLITVHSLPFLTSNFSNTSAVISAVTPEAPVSTVTPIQYSTPEQNIHLLIGLSMVAPSFIFVFIAVTLWRVYKRRTSDRLHGSPVDSDPYPIITMEITTTAESGETERSFPTGSESDQRQRRLLSRKVMQSRWRQSMESTWGTGQMDDLTRSLAFHRLLKASKSRHYGKAMDGFDLLCDLNNEDDTHCDTSVAELIPLAPVIHRRTNNKSTLLNKSKRKQVRKTVSVRNREKVSADLKLLSKRLPSNQMKTLQSFLDAHPENTGILAGLIKTRAATRKNGHQCPWSAADSEASLSPGSEMSLPGLDCQSAKEIESTPTASLQPSKTDSAQTMDVIHRTTYSTKPLTHSHGTILERGVSIADLLPQRGCSTITHDEDKTVWFDSRQKVTVIQPRIHAGSQEFTRKPETQADTDGVNVTKLTVNGTASVSSRCDGLSAWHRTCHPSKSSPAVCGVDMGDDVIGSGVAGMICGSNSSGHLMMTEKMANPTRMSPVRQSPSKQNSLGLAVPSHSRIGKQKSPALKFS